LLPRVDTIFADAFSAAMLLIIFMHLSRSLLLAFYTCRLIRCRYATLVTRRQSAFAIFTPCHTPPMLPLSTMLPYYYVDAYQRRRRHAFLRSPPLICYERCYVVI